MIDRRATKIGSRLARAGCLAGAAFACVLAFAPGERPASGYTYQASVPLVPRYLYVTNSNSNSVSIYEIDATTGNLRPRGVKATGASDFPVTVDPTDTYAFTAGFLTDGITSYTINADGTLTTVGTVSADL